MLERDRQHQRHESSTAAAAAVVATVLAVQAHCGRNGKLSHTTCVGRACVNLLHPEQGGHARAYA